MTLLPCSTTATATELEQVDDEVLFTGTVSNENDVVIRGTVPVVFISILLDSALILITRSTAVFEEKEDEVLSILAGIVLQVGVTWAVVASTSTLLPRSAVMAFGSEDGDDEELLTGIIFSDDEVDHVGNRIFRAIDDHNKGSPISNEDDDAEEEAWVVAISAST